MLWRQYRALHLIKKWLLFKVSWSKSFINQATLLQIYLCGENPTHNCTHMIWTQLSQCINSTLHSSLWAKKSPCSATSLISENGSQWEVSLSLKTPVYVCDLFIYHVLTTRITTDNGVDWATGSSGSNHFPHSVLSFDLFHFWFDICMSLSKHIHHFVRIRRCFCTVHCGHQSTHTHIHTQEQFSVSNQTNMHIFGP